MKALNMMVVFEQSHWMEAHVGIVQSMIRVELNPNARQNGLRID